MRPIWQIDVARHLEEAAGFLKSGNGASARAALGTALAYLLRAAGDGDDDAFALLCNVREAIEQAEPTQRLTWDVHKP
jgi:hypothetical protein